MIFRILSPAEADLAEAVEFYERQSHGLGLRFLGEFEATISRILRCPKAWVRVSKNQRRCLFRRFPFAVLYMLGEKELTVTGVMDVRMNPAKQKRRILDT